MKVCIIGTGYVGLVTGTCFAEIGHQVICVDVDLQKIEKLKQGMVPIYEPGLSDMIKRNMAEGRLSFTTSVKDAAVEGADFFFIAVGTPTRAEDGSADLTYVYNAVEEAASAIKAAGDKAAPYSVFVTKSTVPVGTSQEVGRIIGRILPEGTFNTASNPEFLREGAAISDFMQPDRIVVGAHSEQARKMLEDLYRPLTRQGRSLVVTDTVETAELIKYAANAFLATKITFINELARLCEKVGADIEELALGIGLDSRIGNKFLKTGPGFGGSCFPKDTLALIKTARDYGSPVEIVETIVRVNENHKLLMAEKVREACGGSLEGKKIAVLGLTFKAGTDDVRDSPSFTIIPALEGHGARVVAHDPMGTENFLTKMPALECAQSPAECIEGADAAVIVTEWRDYRDLDWKRLALRMKQPIVIDLRNIMDVEEANSHGLTYISLGR